MRRRGSSSRAAFPSTIPRFPRKCQRPAAASSIVPLRQIVTLLGRSEAALQMVDVLGTISRRKLHEIFPGVLERSSDGGIPDTGEAAVALSQQRHGLIRPHGDVLCGAPHPLQSRATASSEFMQGSTSSSGPGASNGGGLFDSLLTMLPRQPMVDTVIIERAEDSRRCTDRRLRRPGPGRARTAWCHRWTSIPSPMIFSMIPIRGNAGRVVWMERYGCAAVARYDEVATVLKD